MLNDLWRSTLIFQTSGISVGSLGSLGFFKSLAYFFRSIEKHHLTRQTLKPWAGAVVCGGELAGVPAIVGFAEAGKLSTPWTCGTSAAANAS